MRATHAQRRALHFLVEAGGWLPDDPVAIDIRTLRALGDRGWAVLTINIAGAVIAAEPTKLGRAAASWGGARLVQSAA